MGWKLAHVHPDLKAIRVSAVLRLTPGSGVEEFDLL
jgi:hypothetical protein